MVKGQEGQGADPGSPVCCSVFRCFGRLGLEGFAVTMLVLGVFGFFRRMFRIKVLM